jgi:hypothetical protein
MQPDSREPATTSVATPAFNPFVAFTVAPVNLRFIRRPMINARRPEGMT